MPPGLAVGEAQSLLQPLGVLADAHRKRAEPAHRVARAVLRLFDPGHALERRKIGDAAQAA